MAVAAKEARMTLAEVRGRQPYRNPTYTLADSGSSITLGLGGTF